MSSNEEDDIDKRIKSTMEERGLNPDSKKLTDAIKPGKQKQPMRSVDEDFEAIKDNDKDKLRADVDEDFVPTYEQDDEEKENTESENVDEETGYEQGDLPLDVGNLGNMELAAMTNKGPIYRNMMRRMNERQARDTAYWAVKRVINLVPIKWDPRTKEPIKWKYNYKRREINNELLEQIEIADTTSPSQYARHQKLAELYFGVPKKEFDKQDGELWRIIIRAQRFRSEFSFR